MYQAAIPWSDLGVVAPKAGRTISFALVLNDADEGQRMTGGRVHVKWFDGLDTAKNPEGFGDVTLVKEALAKPSAPGATTLVARDLRARFSRHGFCKSLKGVILTWAISCAVPHAAGGNAGKETP